MNRPWLGRVVSFAANLCMFVFVQHSISHVNTFSPQMWVFSSFCPVLQWLLLPSYSSLCQCVVHGSNSSHLRHRWVNHIRKENTVWRCHFCAFCRKSFKCNIRVCPLEVDIYQGVLKPSLEKDFGFPYPARYPSSLFKSSSLNILSFVGVKMYNLFYIIYYKYLNNLKVIIRK